jgi:hypothetical protein
MADVWRVTVTVHEQSLVEQLLDRLRRHEVGDEVVARLGGRVAVTTGNSHIFIYADGEAAAREAERVVQELCREHDFEAEVALHRWHPLEERWEDASVPLPQTEAARQAEYERLQQDEAEESQQTGLAEWEVRIELESHDEAAALADRLEAEGMNPVRRWRYVVVGANNEEEAGALAERLRGEAPAASTIDVEAGPGMVKEGTAGTRFAAWFFDPFGR